MSRDGWIRSLSLLVAGMAVVVAFDECDRQRRMLRSPRRQRGKHRRTLAVPRVKEVAQDDKLLCPRRLQTGREPRQVGAGRPIRDRDARSMKAVRLAEMRVGDKEHRLSRPEERTCGQEGDGFAGNGDVYVRL